MYVPQHLFQFIIEKINSKYTKLHNFSITVFYVISQISYSWQIAQ
jgi:hypothetical protein